MKPYQAFVLLLVGVLIAPVSAFAATFYGGETYVLNSTDVLADNLYVGAGDITLGGTVEGDAIVGGGNLVVSGPIRDDLLSGGGNVSVFGNVGGDARLAGGNLLIGGTVGGDLIAAGGTVKVLDSVSVGKDVTLAGGMVVYSGTTVGDAMFAGSEVLLDGHVAGNVLVEADQKLTLGEHAVIDGALLYRAAREDVLTMSEEAVVAGGVQFEVREGSPADTRDIARGLAVVFGTLFVLKVIALALAAVVLVLVFKHFSNAVVRTVSDGFWLSVLWGFIVLIVVPVAAILLFVTIVGGYLGLLLLVLYGLTLLVTAMYSSVLFGALIMKYFKKESEYTLVWWHALLGVVLLALVGLVPLVGWVVCLALYLATLGSIMQLLKRHIWAHR